MEHPHEQILDTRLRRRRACRDGANDNVDRLTDTGGSNTIQFNGVDSAHIWLARSGNDLVVSVIGGTTNITLTNYFVAGGTQVHAVQTANQALFLKYTAPTNPALYTGSLLDLMTQAGAATPASTSAIPAAVTTAEASFWWTGQHATPTAGPIAPITAPEDAPITGTFAVQDQEDAALTYTFSAPANGTVTLALDTSGHATGNWTYTPKLYYVGPDSFQLTATDPGGRSVSQTVNVTLTAVNNTPTDVQLNGVSTPTVPLTDQAHPLNGKAPAINISTLTGVDHDANQSFTYSFGAGNDATLQSFFTISGNQLLLNASAPLDYYASYLNAAHQFGLKVTVTDQGDKSVTKPFTFTVNPAAVNYFYGNGTAQTINGTPSVNSIVGSTTAENIYTNGTSNYVNGGGGRDTIFGQSGTDTFVLGPDDAMVYAGSGQTRVDTGIGTNRIYAGDGSDSIYSYSSVTDYVTASTGQLTVVKKGTGSHEGECDQGDHDQLAPEDLGGGHEHRLRCDGLPVCAGVMCARVDDQAWC